MKTALFGKLPDKCLTCEEPFDKTNKEMVMTWNVVVREKEEAVHLYCPPCWEKAIEILRDFEERLEVLKEHVRNSIEVAPIRDVEIDYVCF